MKKQILTLIIGILLGAIIATGIFIALESNDSSSDSSQSMEMPSGDFDSNSIGERGERGDGEMPDGEAPDGEAPSDMENDSEDDTKTSEE